MSDHDMKEKPLDGQTFSEGDVEEGVVVSAKDTDDALRFLRRQSNAVAMTPEEEKRLVRKIDWMIVPLMWCCYCLQYLDKTLINYAAVMGLYVDTGITKNQFSTLALVFYVPYLALEFPHGYGMQRLPLARYLGTMVTFWGVIVTVTSACSNWAGLVTTRVLLDCFESAIAPSLILITSMWYTKNEQPPRGTGPGTIFGSLVSFGFQHYTGSTFSSWQIMFLVIGLVTVAIGITVFFVMPNNPMSSRLSEQEKIWAIERVRENQTGIENKHFKFSQALECLRDPQTWMLGLITCSSNVPNGAISSYQATIITGFGYTSEQTALLQIPSGAVSIVSILGATWSAGHFNQRGLNVIVLLVMGIIGGALMAFLPNGYKTGKLIGNYMTNCIGASLPLLYSWCAANYAGHTKKVTMNAFLLMAFCLGNIIGPLTFRGNEAPAYIPAKIAIIVELRVRAVDDVGADDVL